MLLPGGNLRSRGGRERDGRRPSHRRLAERAASPHRTDWRTTYMRRYYRWSVVLVCAPKIVSLGDPLTDTSRTPSASETASVGQPTKAGKPTLTRLPLGCPTWTSDSPIG